MPLISSPIDGSPMREIERYGVKIDICQTSGGIWLDKGELEKMIIMIREEALHEGAGRPAPDPRGAQTRYQEDHYEDREYRGGGQHRRKKRGGMFGEIMDIFDM